MFGSAKTSQDNGLTRKQCDLGQPNWARRAATISVLTLTVLMAGCRPAPLGFPESLNSQRPEERVCAAKQAVDHPYTSPQERRAVMEMLVARLEDEDDAVRFFAILALDRMEGTRLGYSYHDPLERRMRAVQAWRRYLTQQVIQAGPQVNPAQPSDGSGLGSPVAGVRP